MKNSFWDKLGILGEMIKHPREYAILWFALFLVVGAIIALLNTSAVDWRHAYCTANEAQALECTAKGWW